MKIAIIGTGIAGNVVARALYREHDITVFEGNDHIGGHSHTHNVTLEGRRFSVDSGFIVFNHRTYPNFVRLLRELGVAEQASDMSFSVRCDRSGLEYNGTTLNTLFAQRSNLLSLRFHRMLRDILKFNNEAPLILARPEDNRTLGQYVAQNGYSGMFVDKYLVPMGAAIWSTDPARMLDFPARFLVRFFVNHGMLTVNDRPQWYVVKGGSKTYVEALVQPFRDRIRPGSAVRGVRRLPDRVIVESDGAQPERFDAVFVATHSDQALRILQDPSPLESDVLGAIRYQSNDAVLHTDTSVLPRRRRAWAAWNYHIPSRVNARVSLTYNMNILQRLDAPETLCVTLNGEQRIDESRIIRRLSYDHPVFDEAAVRAQARHAEINGMRRTFYCGAYWRFGFHEDGVVSAQRALAHFREYLTNAQLPLSRAG